MTPGFLVLSVQIAPDLRQIVLPDTQEIDPPTARELYERHMIPLRNIGDAAQLQGAGNAPGNLRHRLRTGVKSAHMSHR